MRARTRIAAITLAVAAALTGAIGETPAMASSTPVVQANNDGWRSPSVRPGHIYIGQGGSPYVHALTWHRWNTTRARATGKLAIAKQNCYPSTQCGYTNRWVSVKLRRTVWTHKHYWYTRMRWGFRKNGTWHIWYFKFVHMGTSFPYWNQVWY